jgi:hypothetical protein
MMFLRFSKKTFNPLLAERAVATKGCEIGCEIGWLCSVAFQPASSWEGCGDSEAFAL